MESNFSRLSTDLGRRAGAACPDAPRAVDGRSRRVPDAPPDSGRQHRPSGRPGAGDFRLALKSAHPEAEIGFLCGGWNQPLAEGHPLVASVHSIDHWLQNRGGESLVRKFVRYLRMRRRAIADIRAAGNPRDVDFFCRCAAQYPIVISTTPCGVLIQHSEGASAQEPYAPAAYWPAFGGIADNIARIVDMEQAQQAATILRESFSDRLRAALERSLSVLSRAVPRFFLERDVTCRKDAAPEA
jgi:hypothetical protein